MRAGVGELGAGRLDHFVLEGELDVMLLIEVRKTRGCPFGSGVDSVAGDRRNIVRAWT